MCKFKLSILEESSNHFKIGQILNFEKIILHSDLSIYNTYRWYSKSILFYRINFYTLYLYKINDINYYNKINQAIYKRIRNYKQAIKHQPIIS